MYYETFTQKIFRYIIIFILAILFVYFGSKIIFSHIDKTIEQIPKFLWGI